MLQDIDRIFNVLKYYENFGEFILDNTGNVCKIKLTQHIETWLNQFAHDEQDLIAEVVAKLLEERFITREEEEKWVEDLFNDENICANGFVLTPLDIQRDGHSQERLVKYYQDYVTKKYFKYAPNDVIYLDDVSFSGGRIIQDFANWLPKQRQSYHIHIALIGYHTNIWQTKKKLQKLLNKYNNMYQISHKLTFLAVHNFELENKLCHKNKSDVLWPMKGFFQKNPEYSNFEDTKFQYRDGFDDEVYEIFTDSIQRTKFENICLKYGFTIINKCTTRSETTQPLGHSLWVYGFGGLVFSYANCPNNTPLIFWWGSTKSDEPMHQQWYPLMPRRTYK